MRFEIVAGFIVEKTAQVLNLIQICLEFARPSGLS